jgi:Caspase domain
MDNRSCTLAKSCMLAAVTAVGLAGSALAEKRVALVVGNSSYRYIAALDNPQNDANLIADTLRRAGFTIVGGGAQLDLDKAGFDNAVQRFGKQLQGADVALFYYAGHGVQVRGANYLVPINANPTKEADVDFQMVDANVVLRQMESAGTRLNLVILDACRNNPFGGRGLRATAGGLAQMQAPEGTLISFATQPGNIAQDGSDGHSPYTKALAATIPRAGLDVFRAFNEVGLAVKRATGGAQQPWVSSSPIDGSFYFSGLAPGAAPDPPAVSSPRPSPPASAPKNESKQAALGAAPRLLAQFGAWGAYVGTHDGKKVCYAVAKPRSAEAAPAMARREPTYLMITTRPADRIANEISLIAGYTFRGADAAGIEIGSASFEMYTEGSGAWIRSLSNEEAILNAMYGGKELVLRGVSAQGSRAVDRFSLAGVAQAVRRSAEECR